MTKPLSVEEVYFLVRVGTWDQQQLDAWLQEWRAWDEWDEEELDSDIVEDEDFWDEKDE